MDNTELIRQCEEMLNADAPPSALAVGYLLRRVISALGRAEVVPTIRAETPLTLDELRGMDGEPVWCESLGIPDNSEWAIIDIEADEANGKSGCFPLTLYGWDWMAFRSKPKEDV